MQFIEEFLHELHWLPIVVRIKYKILTIVHKCLNDNKAPANLKNKLIHNNWENAGICAGLRSNDSVMYLWYHM